MFRRPTTRVAFHALSKDPEQLEVTIVSEPLQRALAEALQGQRALITHMSINELIENHSFFASYLGRLERSSNPSHALLQELRLFVRKFLVCDMIWGTSAYHREMDDDIDRLDAGFQNVDSSIESCNLHATGVCDLIDRGSLEAGCSLKNPSDWEATRAQLQEYANVALQELQMNRIRAEEQLIFLSLRMDPQDMRSYKGWLSSVPDESEREMLVRKQKPPKGQYSDIYRPAWAGELGPSIVNAVYADNSEVALQLLKSSNHAIWYSHPCMESLRNTIRNGDLSIARLLLQSPDPLKAAVEEGDMQSISKLRKYGLRCKGRTDLLALAVTKSKPEIATYLLDLGAGIGLNCEERPFRDALLQNDLEAGRNILGRTSRFELLRKSLICDVGVFFEASQYESASDEFKNLGWRLREYRQVWRLGLAGFRRLRRRRLGKSLDQTMSIILVANAMRKETSDEFGKLDLFLDDLDRWREHAVMPEDLPLFDEAMFSFLGKERPIENNVEPSNPSTEVEALDLVITDMISATLEGARRSRPLGLEFGSPINESPLDGTFAFRSNRNAQSSDSPSQSDFTVPNIESRQNSDKYAEPVAGFSTVQDDGLMNEFFSFPEDQHDSLPPLPINLPQLPELQIEIKSGDQDCAFSSASEDIAFNVCPDGMLVLLRGVIYLMIFIQYLLCETDKAIAFHPTNFQRSTWRPSCIAVIDSGR